MSRRIDKIQNILLTIFGFIGQGNGIAFNGDAAFPFDVHIVQHLILKISFIADTGKLDQTVGQGGLAVIYMGDNAEVSNIFHNFIDAKDEKALH